ncbi:DUF1109 domain-containing protein [Sphingomonas donggukensis]|uniref:DUF1109 domain-containing protein n=1 Tax=Sphingomonas donggukensis TaxID=2949093 RepID=A0ABY4TWD0_9SPHN|nr:DUF1109 domain-containing protein [Sphingomonas donggukensis]URW76703.1 DUF1109 domain-containing protein [Sphingomonas donggukensis]
MRTEDLVAALAAQSRAVPRGAVPRRIALAIAASGALTLALVAAWLGLRPDLPQAVGGFPFWMKWGYTISLGAIAVAAVAHLARPEVTDARGLRWLAVPVGVLAVLAIVQLLATPPGDWTALWQGRSWRVCSMKVATLSLPILGGLMLAFRAFAPTRLRLTGAVAGLAAGACAATLYGLHCPEVSALFILVWYSLGILAAAAVGALIGPRLLRW